MDIAVISPVTPFRPDDGHRLAVLSDVRAMLDSQLRVGAIAFTYDNEKNNIPEACPFLAIPAQSGGGISRFVRGLYKGLPPSAERLYTPQAHALIKSKLLEWAPKIVVIDDASVAGYVQLIRDTLPGAKVVLRSHNVMADVRSEQLRRTQGPSRPAVRFDCQRYTEFEKKAVEACDHHWAITESDAQRMTELYGRPTGYLTVSIPLEKYQALGADEGFGNSFVHVGTLDFRRRADLAQFLELSWPKVLRADQGATLTLAGSVHGSAIPAQNVSYSGRVADDADVYRLGRFAVNFQSTTGGVKLKTLTSLAAGRTLLSTPAGVEGLPLASQLHYWDMDEFLSNPHLNEILGDARATQPIADAGRQYVIENHSRAAVARQFSRLLASVQ